MWGLNVYVCGGGGVRVVGGAVVGDTDAPRNDETATGNGGRDKVRALHGGMCSTSLCSRLATGPVHSLLAAPNPCSPGSTASCTGEPCTQPTRAKLNHSCSALATHPPGRTAPAARRGPPPG